MVVGLRPATIFVLYDIWNHSKLHGDAKLLNHYVRLTNIIKNAIFSDENKFFESV